MLTLQEVLADAAASPGFEGVAEVGVNSRGFNGETPLHWMSTLGDPEGLRLLLAAGAVINATDKDGNSALHEAAAMRQTLAVQTLIDHGADLRQKNSSGETPQEVAVASGFAPVVALFKEQ